MLLMSSMFIAMEKFLNMQFLIWVLFLVERTAFPRPVLTMVEWLQSRMVFELLNMKKGWMVSV